MQTLDYKDLEGNKHTENYPVPVQSKPIDVEVTFTDVAVVMKIDGRSIYLPIKGARDLALALRQAANAVEGHRHA